jgi:glycolate oxidase iron-sulfur subunit
MLKEYVHLLKDDPLWAERARRFSAKVRDSNEFLAARVKADPPSQAPALLRARLDAPTASKTQGGSSRLRVTYHDPCHLLNTQKVKTQPREMLRSIPGIELVELPESNWCCGSAGIYNITHPDMARKVLARKIDAIASTGASILVTANPGCLMQMHMGLAERGLPIRVMHISELLDQAYSQAEL